MRIVEKAIFTFEELSPQAKNKACDFHRDINVDHDWWWWWTYDDYKEQLSEAGFHDAEIRFSGFWSQGDGASFEATIDLPTIIKAQMEKTKDAKELRTFKRLLILDSHELLGECFITRYDNCYMHKHSCSVSLNSYSNVLQSEHDLLEEIIERERLEWCNRIYKSLENEYESLTSDAEIANTLQINDFEFCQDGHSYIEC